MKIDRHNYEEYFLLYIDNELTVEQMKQVELFVTENPDLEEELVMLHQSRLIPDDTIVFDDKHLLMKEVNDSFINMNNYEEWLVSYVDNEMNEEQRIAVEKFAANHPRVQQELGLFRQTKLQPEKIFFADKKVLYKRESARIVSMQWWRISVAAMLVLAAGVGVFSIFNKKSSTGNGPIANEVVKKVTPASSTNINTSNKDTSVHVGRVQPAPENQNSIATRTSDKIDKKDNRKQKIIGEKSDEPRLAMNSTRAHIDTPDQIAVQSKSPEIAKINENALNDKINTRKIVDSSVTYPTVETPHVMYASNTDNDENKRFRGFFRKASRIIERSTNVNPTSNDDRVLIGGMAINLK